MKDVLYTLYVGMFISAKRNSFQNTLCIQLQRIYGQIIYIKLCKSPLDRLFEKGNGGGAKGRKEGKSRKWEFHPEGCICAILRV